MYESFDFDPGIASFEWDEEKTVLISRNMEFISELLPGFSWIRTD